MYINNDAEQIISQFTLNGTRIADYAHLNGVPLAKIVVLQDPDCVDPDTLPAI